MTRPHRHPSRLVRLGPFAEPVRFTGCDDLLAALRTILRGWRVTPLDPRRSPAPALRVSRSRRGWRRVSSRYDRAWKAREKERRTLIEALCGLHGELLDWYLEAHPQDLFIHGAAVQFGRRLVVFPALAKAGKSTLTVALAAAGYPVYTDDVLPIDTTTARGFALGIVTRLRPPLPASLGRRFHGFVRSRAGLSNKSRLYVLLRRGELAPLGATLPVGGIVLLEREAGARARLSAIDPADALERVILQQYARDRPSPLILDTLARVAEGATCYSLRYSRVEPAIALLAKAFGPPRLTGRPARPARRPARGAGRRRRPASGRSSPRTRRAASATSASAKDR